MKIQEYMQHAKVYNTFENITSNITNEEKTPKFNFLILYLR